MLLNGHAFWESDYDGCSCPSPTDVEAFIASERKAAVQEALEMVWVKFFADMNVDSQPKYWKDAMWQAEEAKKEILAKFE